MGIDQRAPDVRPAQGVLLEKAVALANKFARGCLVSGTQRIEGPLGEVCGEKELEPQVVVGFGIFAGYPSTPDAL